MGLKNINIEHIYKTLHDTVNYTREEEDKIKEHAFIYLRVDYGLELNLLDAEGKKIKNGQGTGINITQKAS